MPSASRASHDNEEVVLENRARSFSERHRTRTVGCCPNQPAVMTSSRTRPPLARSAASASAREPESLAAPSRRARCHANRSSRTRAPMRLRCSCRSIRTSFERRLVSGEEEAVGAAAREAGLERSVVEPEVSTIVPDSLMYDVVCSPSWKTCIARRRISGRRTLRRERAMRSSIFASLAPIPETRHAEQEGERPGRGRRQSREGRTSGAASSPRWSRGRGARTCRRRSAGARAGRPSLAKSCRARALR